MSGPQDSKFGHEAEGGTKSFEKASIGETVRQCNNAARLHGTFLPETRNMEVNHARALPSAFAVLPTEVRNPEEAKQSHARGHDYFLSGI